MDNKFVKEVSGIEEGYQQLATAIIIQAIDDLVVAYRNIRKFNAIGKKRVFSPYERTTFIRYKNEASKIERWFLNGEHDRFILNYSVDGYTIIKKAQEKAGYNKEDDKYDVRELYEKAAETIVFDSNRII